MKQPDASKNDTLIHRILDPYIYNNLLCYCEDVVYVTTDRSNKRTYDYNLCLLTELHLTFIKSSVLKLGAVTIDSHYTWIRYDEIESIDVLYDKPEFFNDQSMIDACVHIRITYNNIQTATGKRVIDLYTFYEDTRLYYMLHSIWFNYYTYIALQPVYDHIDIASLNSTGQYTLYTYLENALCNTNAADYKAKLMSCDELSIAVASNRGIKNSSLNSGKLITYIVTELRNNKHIRLLCTHEYVSANEKNINSVQIDALRYIISLLQLLNRMLVGSEIFPSRMNIIHTTSSTQTLNTLFDDLLLLDTNQTNAALLQTVVEHGIIDDDYVFDINVLYGLIEQFDVTMAELINNILSLCEYSTLTALQNHAAVSVDTVVSRFVDPTNNTIAMQYLVDLSTRICQLLQVNRQPALSYYIYCCINILQQLCSRSIPICTYVKQHSTHTFTQYIVSKSHHNNILPDINETSMFYYIQSKKQLNTLLNTLGIIKTQKVQLNV